MAFASIPAPGGVIYGCYEKSGDVRVIDSAISHCKGKETALNWNQTGPQGPAGPAGPAGPQGMAGSAGVSGYEMQSASNFGFTLSVSCPTGKQALGGGGRSADPADPLAASYPNVDANGWTVALAPTGQPSSAGLRAWVICAKV